MVIPYYLIDNFTNIDYENLTQGGEAYIVKGTHPFLQGDIAIKRWSHSSHNYSEKNIMHREATLLMQSKGHPNIIKLLGILIDKESNYIGYIMPYMDRGSLDDVIHNRDKDYYDVYTSEQVTSWITQICLGLSYLHSKNIIHRDIKPRESINDLKLADFGIARSLEKITYNLTTGIGTPEYMAPEMLNNKIYDISADIYSLSITIWEILHRRSPFDHIAPDNLSKFELYNKISNGARPELEIDLSEEVVDLLKRCWHDNASQRPKINDVLEFSKNTGFQLSEKQTVLLLGGHDGSKVLDSLVVLRNNGGNKEDWKKVSIKLPYQVQLHGAQFLKNNLYIFGGQNAKEETLNSTYKLSKKLEWEKMADMNEKRERMSNSNLIPIDRIWVLGGWNGKEALKSVEIYDPSKNEWKYMKQMNECRSNAAAAVVNGKIFCCGGWSGEKLLNSTECYDPSSDVWTFISNMPQPLWGLGAVAINGKLIVIGGSNSKKESRSVWELNTSDTNAEWIEKSCMSLGRRWFSIAKIDDKIFVCGGKSDEDIIFDAEIFNGEVWKNGPKLPTGWSGSTAVVISANFVRYFN